MGDTHTIYLNTGTVQLPCAIAPFIGVRTSMKHHGVAVGIQISASGSIDANIVGRTEKNTALSVLSVDGVGPGVLDIVVVGGVAVGAVEEHVLAAGHLVQGRRLHHSVVGGSLVVEDGRGAAFEGQGVAGHLMDHDGRGLVASAGGSGLARRRASEAVAIDLPNNPPIGTVIVAGGIDHAAAGSIANERLALSGVWTHGAPRGGSTDAVVASVLMGCVIHDISASVLEGTPVVSKTEFGSSGS